MQKFDECGEPLSTRRNIVVMADEAHRGQYGLRGFISPLCVKHFLLLQQFPLNTLLPCVFQVKLSPFGMGVGLDSVYEKRFPPPSWAVQEMHSINKEILWAVGFDNTE